LLLLQVPPPVQLNLIWLQAPHIAMYNYKMLNHYISYKRPYKSSKLLFSKKLIYLLIETTKLS
jgi:hypothetical protein